MTYSSPETDRPAPPPRLLNGTAPAPVPNPDEPFEPRAILAVARRRWWLIAIVGTAVGCGIWFKVLNEPPRYRSSFELLVEPIAGDRDFAELSESLSNLGPGGRLDYPTQIQVLRSAQVMGPIHDSVQATYPNLSYSQLAANLRIQRLGDTKILRVTYESTDPQLVGAVLEEVARGYIAYSEREQQTGQQRAMSSIEDQLPQIRDRVESIQERLQQFRQRHNTIDPEVLGRGLTASLTELEAEQRQAEVSLEENRSLRASLQEQLGLGLEEAVTTVVLSSAPRYQELLDQLQTLETEIAVELTRFKPGSPNIQVLEEQREGLLALLDAEARAVLNADRVSSELRDRVASPNPIRLQLTQDLLQTNNQIAVTQVRQQALALAENQLRQEIESVAALAREYRNIQVELNVATESLNRFLALRERLQLEVAQQTLPWQMLEAPSVPGSPFAPDVLRGLGLGVMAGLFAGAVAAYLAEKLDTKFHSPEAVKEISGLPLLGVIPFQRGMQQRSLVLPPPPVEENGENGNLETGRMATRSFPFQEAFRSLNTNLSFMSPDAAIRSVSISSCIPKEGKTTTSVHLAQAAATMGRRVLLVDADMRRPQLHQMMELPNICGLSNAISTGIDWREAVQPSPTSENLFVMTSGPKPPDPTRLLSSQAMKGLVEEWEAAYDLVIFDTPPLGGLADAKLLSVHTSGLILVAGLGIVDRALFREVLETLHTTRTTLLGIIANARRSANTESAYYYYYYYYSYYYAGSDSKLGPRRRVAPAANSDTNSDRS